MTDTLEPQEIQYHPYSNEKLETIARTIISRHNPRLTKELAPIPIEDIMERSFGLQLDYQHIRKNLEILGETIFEDCPVGIYDFDGGEGYKLIPAKAGTVIIDVRLLDGNNGRLRFTYAHELAHWVIDKQYFIQKGETARMTNKPTISSDVHKKIENQADRLASRLLMPKCTLKNAFYHNQTNRLDTIANLADLYQVSKQAMEIRLIDLGLLVR